MARTTLASKHTLERNEILYVAFELSKKTWKLGCSDGLRRQPRVVGVRAGDLDGVNREVMRAKKRLGLPPEASVVSCYEAGRDGFWIHRALTARGFSNIVVDPASIEVNRRSRRAKTDRLDAIKLANQLVRWHAGEKGVWGVVRVPSVEDEDERHLHRGLEILKRTRRMHRTRIQSLLFAQGVNLRVKKTFLRDLDTIRLWDGSPIPDGLRQRLLREHELLDAVQEQIRRIDLQRRAAVDRPKTRKQHMVAALMQLYGVGLESAWLLGMEFFWRRFANRREVGASAGLTPTPYQSGSSPREQGISKAGNGRVRTMMVELAWCWLRFQPASELAAWYRERFGEGANRKVGLIALARRLLIELGIFVEQGVVPHGARLRLPRAAND